MKCEEKKHHYNIIFIVEYKCLSVIVRRRERESEKEKYRIKIDSGENALSRMLEYFFCSFSRVFHLKSCSSIERII